MTDTVRVEMSQFSEDKKISYVLVEWYDMDRNTANLASMDLVKGVVAKADEWREVKAAMTAELDTPKGTIR